MNPDNVRLEISYVVIRLGSQQGLRYRYIMEGLEPWNEVYARRTAYYTHLAPGKYRFRVQAYEEGNPGAVSEASILIVQEPHFYATAWFLLCCAAALIALAILIHWLRLRQIRIRYQVIGEERARLAREMHDTLIQGCVGVSTLLEAALEVEASDAPMRKHLLDFATDQIRGTIESAREAVWSLRNNSSSPSDLGSLCEQLARKFQAESHIPIACRISGTSVGLDEQATHEVIMTVREALANAIAHAKPTRVQIDVRFLAQELTIEIRDNGRGFGPGDVPADQRHYGIRGMQERMQSLCGTLAIESRSAHGTVVRMVVPRRQRKMERIEISNVNGNA